MAYFAGFAIMALALGLATLPTPAWVVETVYSDVVFPTLQRLVTSLSNLMPFTAFDLLIVVAVPIWMVLGARDFARRGWWRATARTVARTVVWAATAYVLFLLMWGLNYRRVPITERLDFDANAVTDEAVQGLAARAVHELTVGYARAHAEGWPAAGTIEPALAGAFERAVGELVKGRATRVVVARPKHTVFDWYLRTAGVDGMTNPFLLETLVARDLLPFERPFVVAHEWSHLAGLADEGEANVAGWLTCMRGSMPDRYSGWLFLYGELVRSLRPSDRAAVAAQLGPGPREDLLAIRARLRQHVNPRVSAAGFRLYDSYLKANRIEAGAHSYGEVVKLVLGLRMTAS